MLQSRRPHTRATRPIRSPPGAPRAPALGEPPLGGNPPMTRHLLIVNPASGRGTAEQRVPLLKEAFDALGLSFDLVRTEGPMHAAELSQKGAADGYDVVVAVGGDGTANEVINGLMRAQEAAAGPIPALGVLFFRPGNQLPL